MGTIKIGAVADNAPIRPPYCAQKQCSGKIEHGYGNSQIIMYQQGFHFFPRLHLGLFIFNPERVDKSDLSMFSGMLHLELPIIKIGTVADNVPIRPPYHCAQKQYSGKIEHG
ncbi:MAG: hypothetical protein DRR19_32895 [Candidatus Parabeggiatoa sp. nov. 1]|nr:MAG: hypothetical protein DRR19_32895 [Gammaproteobacteria bacterium]